MSNLLDRPGIFKAKPLDWKVRRAENSKAVAISFRFVILAWLKPDNTWEDWAPFEEYHVFGDYYIVKKDGGVNARTVEQLAAALGWRGSLSEVAARPPPDVMVQVSVKEEEYQGKVRLKAGWMNPGNYEPTSGGEDEASVKELDALFGSQLRAAASAAAPKKVSATKPSKPEKPPAAAVRESIAPLGTGEFEDTPF